MPGARRTPWSEISKTGSKTERNYASTGWLDVCSQPGPRGQKMLGLPHGFSPSGVVDDVGFNLTALMLIIYGVWKFHSTSRRKERWKQYAKNGDIFGKKEPFLTTLVPLRARWDTSLLHALTLGGFVKESALFWGQTAGKQVS